MAQENRSVCFDTELQVEAYRFEGIMQKFPNHFHDYYVLGFIEQGKRYLTCKNGEYIINTGDVIIFNPGDPHACEQVDGRTLDYRCLNIQPEVMKKYVLEITGRDKLPYFTKPVLCRSEIADGLHELHLMITEGHADFKKEELLLFLIEQLLIDYTEDFVGSEETGLSSEIRTICEYIDNNYHQTITLQDLCQLTGLSKYYLLRSFTKQKGISPYCYVETQRMIHAKKLLQLGIPPIEAAIRTGFSDQSHFSNFFKKLIGLTPKQYMRIFTEQSPAGVTTEVKTTC
ncbi:AraC family transcriptional regulator [Neobacillus mesonae]|nr:AraC family transcriptional regulator [Neobacillus mesonae]